MNENFKIKEGVNKIRIMGDRNDDFILAYLELPKEFKNELDKVLSVILFDGNKLSINEMK